MGKDHKQVSPLSLMVTGFSRVTDIRKTVTPDLKRTESILLLIDLGAGKNRMGGSTLAQVYNQIGSITPDLDDPEKFKGFFALIQELIANDLLLSYHDRSDGGLIACLAEMAISGRTGIQLLVDKIYNPGHYEQASEKGTESHESGVLVNVLSLLFTEELGAVIEIEKAHLTKVTAALSKHDISDITHIIGQTTKEKKINISFNNDILYSESITTINRAWSELSFQMKSMRDNPDCAKEEFDALLDESDLGTIIKPTFNINEVEAFEIAEFRPKMAILREQGINGQNEMAFAFDRVGFQSVDIHMTDLLAGRVDLAEFAGLVACGGFSYGDVLGAGSGWAKSILYNPKLADMFQRFFERPNSFSLGVCNGCQMLSQLKDIIPGAEQWPEFYRNSSEQFESRYANVEVLNSPSLFFKGYARINPACPCSSR